MTRRVARLSFACAALLATAGICRAQEAPAALPERVTLEDVMRLLNERSPRTLAERATVDIVAADRLTADALPNPSVSYDGAHLVHGLSTGAVTTHQIVVDQPLLIFGQREARREWADLNKAAEQARVASSLADRRFDVRQAFATLLARQQDLVILQESRTEMRRIEDVVKGRAAAGDQSRYDVLRIETEGRTLDIEARNAATDVEDASGHLAALLGFPGWRPRVDGTLQPGNTPTDLDGLWTTARRQRPSIVAAEHRQVAANGGLLAARRERLPVPAISGGVLMTHEDTGNSIVFGTSVPLPIFDRNRGAIARAAAEFAAETRAVEAEFAETHAELEHAVATFVSKRETLDEVERGLVQQVPTLRQMAEDAYREGRGSILELLDASRSWKEIALLHVRQLETTKLAEEAVIAAAGLDALPIP